MNPNRRGFIGLLSALPIVGDKVAAAALSNNVSYTKFSGAMLLRETLSTEDSKEYVRKAIPTIKRFHKEQLRALMNLIQSDTTRYDTGALDVDLAHNRSMSLAAINYVQRQRNRERQRQVDLLTFKQRFGFEFNVDNPRETILRIKQDFDFHEDKLFHNEKDEWKLTTVQDSSDYSDYSDDI